MSTNNGDTVEAQAQDAGAPRLDDNAEPKVRKACSECPVVHTVQFLAVKYSSLFTVNCRKQKMKCIAGTGNTCRRCQRSGVPCIFVPRANAAGLPSSWPGMNPANVDFNQSVLRRLKVIEDYLGLDGTDEHTEENTVTAVEGVSPANSPNDAAALGRLWGAVACLEKICAGSVNPAIWKQSTVKHLWSTYVPSEKDFGDHLLTES